MTTIDAIAAQFSPPASLPAMRSRPRIPESLWTPPLLELLEPLQGEVQGGTAGNALCLGTLHVLVQHGLDRLEPLLVLRLGEGDELVAPLQDPRLGGGVHLVPQLAGLGDPLLVDFRDDRLDVRRQ